MGEFGYARNQTSYCFAAKSFEISKECSWVNYIRCHDDIGWTFDDKVAQQLGINGFDHRKFLNQFYTGRFEGSFAKGVPFQENPATGDCRVCGSLASLAGLERAIQTKDPLRLEYSAKRVRLLNSINLSIGGIPLIYQGDELGILNDYSYEEVPHKREDSRWVNRPAISDKAIQLAHTQGTAQWRIHQDLTQMIKLRKSSPVFGESTTEILETYQPHLFAYARCHENGEKLLVICNFAEKTQTVPSSICDILGSKNITDMLSGKSIANFEIDEDKILLNGYDVVWFKVN
ncbi:hypothetical protein P7F88_05445 [Vibrio hannami]|uniref:hypothetical protein n=1 Tax=Vibrio hannami TaxID=2717094 RepID=UPI00240F945F|nr:hypothetical protein [Vibrio hannami]MDG3085577.1 hypothetical protein [Vibrio hannami]